MQPINCDRRTERVNEIRGKIENLLKDSYFNWQEQIPRLLTKYLNKKEGERNCIEPGKDFTEIINFLEKEKDGELVKKLVMNIGGCISIKNEQQRPKISIDPDKVDCLLNLLDEEFQRVRFIQILFTYALLFYIEAIPEYIEDDLKETWISNSISLSSRMLGLLHLMRPIVLEYRDEFHRNLEVLSKKKKKPRKKQEAYEKIIQAKSKAITSSISGKFKYGNTITSHFQLIDQTCRTNSTFRRSDATSGSFLFSGLFENQPTAVVYTVEQLAAPSNREHRNDSLVHLAEYLNLHIRNICENTNCPFIIKCSEKNGAKVNIESPSEIENKPNLLENIIFWNGSGMTIPEWAHLSYTFNRLFPYIDILQTEDNTQLVYEENAWNSILLTPTGFVDFDKSKSNAMLRADYGGITYDPFNPDPDFISNIVPKDMKRTFGNEDIKIRTTILKGQKDFELAFLVLNKRLHDGFSEPKSKIHIQLPYNVPKADPLTEISDSDDDEGHVDIVLTTS